MRLKAKRVLFAAAAVTALGCGGGGANNDNGVGVTLAGFTALQDGVCSPDIYVATARMPISEGAVAEQPGGYQGIFGCYQVRNSLVSQAVRIDRALLRYFIPGASIQPPSTVAATSALLPAATGNTSLPNPDTSGKPGTKPGGTLPSGGGGASGGSSQVTSAFTVVPVAIREWVSAHRGDLPPPPFDMIGQVQLSGVTSSGNRIETNEAVLTVVVTGDNTF